MAHSRLTGVLCHLRQAAGASGPGGPTDAELLARFVAHRDHAAFELLVWRHGAMVLQTCRRLLGRYEDAEDAFQATFLTLVRRAKAIKRGEVVAGWLHTVACRAALRARSAAARRTELERHALPNNGHEPASDQSGFDPVAWAEMRTLIDQELSRLSAKLRDPFVLCCLEGLTNEEAARQIGCPKGTVLSRLSRARERLRARLSRRGIGLPATAFTAALSQEAAAALAPAPLVLSTVKAATLLAAGQATAGVISAPVAALTEGVIRAMFLTKLKMVVATVVVVGGVVAGSGGLVHLSTATAQIAAQKQPAAKASSSDKVDQSRAALAQADEAKVRAQAEAELAKARLRATEQEVQIMQAKLRATEQEVQIMQAKLRATEVKLEAAKAQYELARINLEKASQETNQPRTGAEPPAEPQPKKPAQPPQTTQQTPKQPRQNPLPYIEDPRAAANQAATLTGGASLDLVHLANSYVDAIRDMQTAKVNLKEAETRKAVEERISKPGSNDLRQCQQQWEISRINLQAAERKADLLKAIIQGSLRGAENEYQIARRQHASGIASLEPVNVAQTKIDVLKLILDSAK